MSRGLVREGERERESRVTIETDRQRVVGKEKHK